MSHWWARRSLSGAWRPLGELRRRCERDGSGKAPDGKAGPIEEQRAVLQELGVWAVGIIPGTEPVEVREAVMGRAERFEGAEFRTGSYSQPKDPGGPVVAFGRESWARFIDGVAGR